MPAAPSPADGPPNLRRRLVPLGILAALAILAFLAVSQGVLSLEGLVRHRMAIDAFVAEHRAVAVLIFMAIYIVTVGLSVPGATFLTIAGGFLFGIAVGAGAAAIGATIGATIIFLLARTALGEPLLKRAGPRAAKLAREFREDAFSYLLFLRLVPLFPFFLVNLVPALAGVRLATFVAATALGIIPASLVYALAGTGLDSVIAVQVGTQRECLAAGRSDCTLSFDAKDVLTPEMIGALVALGLLALVPVLVKRWRRRAHAPS